ncbi:MAG TPA: 3-oxoadipate enol-lactonase [Desulfomonilia bacterium]|nr:3-oxoadipate enol-lactonase [Desulfomonilia bacterium]
MPLAQVNTSNLFYSFDGPDYGDVIMFSNSLAADITMWDNQVHAFSQAGYRVLRYDSRGHGRSAAPEGPYSLDLLSSDAVGLMDVLGLEKVHFCGLSMGGMVGQMIGARYGKRLISLALSSTSAHISPRELWDERIKMVRSGGMAAVADATVDRWFTKPGQERIPTEVEKIRRIILSTPVEGYCACCAAIRDMDLRYSLNTISTKVLVLVGKDDQGTPVSAAQYIHDQIGSSEMIVIPEAAHFVNVEQANKFNEALLNFLEQVAAS